MSNWPKELIMNMTMIKFKFGICLEQLAQLIIRN